MPTEIATFGAGCFWGVEHLFRRVPGVTEAISGYSGGFVENPSYQLVCTDTTGHAEVVQVTFDTEVVSYDQLLEVRLHQRIRGQVRFDGIDALVAQLTADVAATRELIPAAMLTA